MRKARLIGLVVGISILGRGLRAQDSEAGLPGLVLELATDSLKDVAVAVYTPWRGVIYYNPALERELGPDLVAFFRAHEFGHLYLHHTRANALAGAGPDSPDSLLQARELEADCYATIRLARSSRPAVEAAVRFFSRMGRLRFDAEHPSGAERAARILACIPTELAAGG